MMIVGDGDGDDGNDVVGDNAGEDGDNKNRKVLARIGKRRAAGKVASRQ